jgi:MFS family permease
MSDWQKIPFGFLDPLAAYLHPKKMWLHQRINLRRLWAAPTPETRYLIMSGVFWTFPLAFTEPYKSLFYSRLGLSNAAIGGILGLDNGLRVLGLLIGGWATERFGPKKTLITFDFLSWSVPSAMLAFATQPWHLVLAACFFSSNSLATVAYQILFTHRIPEGRLARTYALANVLNVLPNTLLPSVAAYLVSTQPFMPAMRMLFALQAVLMLIGILLRVPTLKDIAVQPAADARLPMLEQARFLLGRVRQMLRAPRIKTIGWLFVITNTANAVFNSYIGIYLVRELKLPDHGPGLWSQVGSVFFVLGSFWLVPALKERQLRGALFLGFLLSGLAMAGLLLKPDLTGALALTAVMGAGSAVVLAVLQAFFAARLPETGRAWGFAMAFVVQQALMGLAYPLAGSLFTAAFFLLPWVLLAVNMIQVGFAFRLWNLDRPVVRSG